MISGDTVEGCEQCLFSVEGAILQLTLPKFWAAMLPRRYACPFQCSTAGTDMTRPPDHTGELASPSEPNSAAPLPQPASDERRAPTAILSSAKRAALIACLNGGSLHRRCGVWTAPSASVGDKPISGATVADLGRDGMLTLSVLHGSAYARLTARGSWFARTVVTELAERAVP
jgi:hypothetical protein